MALEYEVKYVTTCLAHMCTLLWVNGPGTVDELNDSSQPRRLKSSASNRLPWRTSDMFSIEARVKADVSCPSPVQWLIGQDGCP